MNNNRNKYKNIAVLGGGESGTGAALLASKHGINVFVSDAGKIKPNFKETLIRHKISFEEDGHQLSRILDADLIIKSPGIPDTANIIAQTAMIPKISEIEFASWFTDAKLIGITGSNGKTTTTLLTGYLLSKGGINVCVAGNVGKSFAGQLAESDHDIFVLELSSFQLDGTIDFKVDIAVITNITPDHLDRYQYDFNKYAQSKMRITLNQDSNDALVYCADDPETVNQIELHQPLAKKYPFSLHPIAGNDGAFVQNEKIYFNIQNNNTTMTLEELALQGKHNTYNSLAAGVSAKLLHIRGETLKQCLSDYQNIAHRLEFVANVHGVSYFNDSKATNVNSTWYALESFDRPIIWIAGGIDKGNDYTSLIPLIKKKVKAIICMGADNTKLHQVFAEHVEIITDVSSAEQAVAVASFLAAKNDIVLLSPSCASFDLFENFEMRGNRFKAAVKRL
ncbi:MAG: UDP-N-acetylmuramoyl-L-alanine--D-glutamate ligase [Bacteroidetes bacterium HGW-Bacteroidetes-1]|jgi:UDP-N-acetylmuramoylalanine--D-glutamate ligase|nr:MAG: UDP-N-acetylmuramoyl-L-alanine--D-glutamate ligase [Bacteroidetes bacterium HGW-Bacteroidetes-1]